MEPFRTAQPSDYITVALKPHELAYAHATGVMRYYEARRLGLASSYASEERDKEAAAAELAFAIALDLSRQLTVNKFKVPDIAGWQVRSTRHEAGRLMVRPGDADEEPFVLARGTGTVWEIFGWIRGKDAKQPQWARNPGGIGRCWMVPAWELRPVK